MSKFLAGYHHNEEQISQHLKKIYIYIGPSKLMATSLQPVNPEKTSRSCEGADFRWLSSKVSRTLIYGHFQHQSGEFLLCNKIEFIFLESNYTNVNWTITCSCWEIMKSIEPQFLGHIDIWKGPSSGGTSSEFFWIFRFMTNLVIP